MSAGLVCSACSPGGGGGSGGAPSDASVLGLYQYRALDAAGFTLEHPADGRLRGFDFAAKVTGYGESSFAGSGYSAVVAPRGGTLYVVSLELSSVTPPDDGASLSGSMTASFVVGHVDVAFESLSVPGAGLSTYVVSAPRGVPVSFDLAEAGVTAAFSLTTGRRIGTAPAVLYRAPDSPDLVVRPGERERLRVVDRADGFSVPDVLGLDEAYLSWSAPQNALVHPSSEGDAFLVVHADEQAVQVGNTDNPDYVSWNTAAPPSALRLVLAGGREIEASPQSPYVTNVPNDLLDGQYYFVVPAAFTSGTLVITPGTLPATEYGVPDTGASTYDRVVGSARFPVAFPAPPRPTTSSHPATRHHHPAAHRASRRTGSGSGNPWTLVVLVLVLAIVAAVGVRRLPRRRRRLAVDADGRRVRPQPALPFVPRLALPPGPPTRDAPIRPAELGPAPVTDPERAPATFVDDEAGGPVVVSFLGPLVLSGIRQRPKRRKVIALCCLLACFPERRFTSEELRSKLWPMGDDPFVEEGNADSLRTYFSELRRCVGRDRLPDAEAGTYQFAGGVETDWGRFRSLVAVAESSPVDEAVPLYRDALSLVRGAPFSDVKAAGYEWVFEMMLVNEIERAIESAALSLAELGRLRGDVDTVVFAAERGLAGVLSYSLCEVLLEAAYPDPGRRERAWRTVSSRPGIDLSLLEPLLDRLRSEEGADLVD